MITKKLYIKKPLAIIQDKRLTPLEQDYLCLIAALQNASGCIASNNYLAEYFGVKRPRAVEVITNLKNKGFVKSYEKKQGAKTIERTIWIVDNDSMKALLTNSKEILPNDSKKTPAGLVRKAGFDSKKSPTPILNSNNKSYSSFSQKKFKYCFVDKEPAVLEIQTGRGLQFICEDCKKLLDAAPDFRRRGGLIIHKSRLEPGQLETMILNQKAKR